MPTKKTAAKKAATKGDKSDALDLIAPKKKRTPAKKRSAPAKEAEIPVVSRVSEKAKIGGKAVAEAKESALNLFEDEEKKANKPKTKPVEKEEASVFQSFTSGGGEKKKAPAPVPEEEVEGEDTEEEKKVIHLKPPIIVKELADLMEAKSFVLIKDLMALDVFVNQNQSIEPEIAAQICEQHGFIFEREKREKGAGIHKVEEVVEEPEPEVEIEVDKLVERPPIVTIMGHVDHGKTSLLDAIRDARVVDGEAGGITQHIAAYSVEHNGKKATFIDTPGHEAFSAMRARGADVTDIVVLVIAANDGIMPTTIEAINHAKAAGVEIIVAVNKIDLPSADPTKARQQLQAYDLAPEEWGGKTICVDVSATKGTGIEDLLEMISLQAEVLELRADPKATTRATVIEARMEPGRGATASLIVQAGTLKVGLPFICGNQCGKIKSMFDDQGKSIKTAGPATPVEVLGFSDVPSVGDELVQMENERKAKKLSIERLEEVRMSKLKKPVHSTLEGFMDSIAAGQHKTMKVVLKTDVQGSAQAITGALAEITSDKIDLEVIHCAAGSITETDIHLASSSDAVILGFNTKQEPNSVRAAKREGVQVKLYSIIYELLDQVREAMLGLLDPETRERNLGYAEVKMVFKLSSGRVAGCMVTKGKILRSGRARVLRGRQPVYDGGVHTLKRFTEDATEVKNGLECGIRLGNFNDYEEGDIIECYELEKVAQTL
ncbi:MAG: translation initiation factor IF-2 [Verrucomicrobiales bacterium]|jgi:translation initiation factor IF-2